MSKTDGGRWGTCEWGEEEVRLGVDGEGLDWGGWVYDGYCTCAAHVEWLVWGRGRGGGDKLSARMCGLEERLDAYPEYLVVYVDSEQTLGVSVDAVCRWAGHGDSL